MKSAKVICYALILISVVIGCGGSYDDAWGGSSRDPSCSSYFHIGFAESKENLHQKKETKKMTTPSYLRTIIEYDIIVKCSVCNKESKQSAIASTSFGMDLDTRPPEPHKSTMEYWIQECPNCGYVSDSLEKPINCNREYLNTMEYKDFTGILPASELTQKYIRKARISVKARDYNQAFMDYLHAAWVSDDEEDEAWLIESRIRALQMMDMFSDNDMKDEHHVMRADLLRKTSQFERLVQEYENIHFDDDLLNRIIQFQISKAKNQDMATYTVEDVCPEDSYGEWE